MVDEFLVLQRSFDDGDIVEVGKFLSNRMLLISNVSFDVPSNRRRNSSKRGCLSTGGVNGGNGLWRCHGAEECFKDQWQGREDRNMTPMACCSQCSERDAREVVDVVGGHEAERDKEKGARTQSQLIVHGEVQR